MAKSGGYGTIDKNGNRVIYVNGRQRPEHCVVWERHNGPISKGDKIHHKDENKLNNKIENLELVPKSSTSEGHGYIDHNGYRVIRVDGQKRLEHRVVWEQYYGPIPQKYEVHHIDENRLNNRIENLELLDRQTHARIHNGFEFRDGEWWRSCTKCGRMLPTSEFYKRGNGVRSWCKECHNRTALENYYKRKEHEQFESEQLESEKK